ncbi:sporulation integral membrane protein YtvI [Metabacillus sp. 84]|uniref:sporulation integral membrane protein YtvI n=1 Tax=unclassified Metabacillus TaxID=2675274 RepID=UPI003CE6E9D6
MNQLAGTAGRGLIAAGALAGICLLVYWILPVMYPFVLAFFLAWFIKKPAGWIHRTTGLPAGLSAGLVLISLITLFSGLGVLMAIEFIAVIQKAAVSLPAYLNHMSAAFRHILSYQAFPFIEKISEQFSALTPGQQSAILAELQQAGDSLINEAGSMLRTLLNEIPAILLWLPNAASVLVIIIIAAFFICNDWDRVILFINRRLPQSVSKRLDQFGSELGKALAGLLKAQLLLNMVTMAAVFPGLLLLGVENALSISLLVGLVDFIPYAGTGTIFIPWVLYLLLMGQSKLASGLAVLYLVIMMARQFLEPRIYSKSIGLNPLLTLMSIYAGYKCFGLLGMALGPVVLVILQSLYKLRLFHDIWKYVANK